MDNGTTWAEVSAGFFSSDVFALAVSPRGGGTAGTNLFAGSYGTSVFLSTDSGTTWTAADSGLPNIPVECIAVSDANLFAGTQGGVYRSTDDGTTWIRATDGLTNATVRALAVSGTDVFAGTWNDGVFRSTNNGTSWIAVNSGLSSRDGSQFPCVISFAVSGTNIFAGTFTDGIFLTTNNGGTWTEVDSGLTPRSIGALAVSETHLFAGTGDRYWWDHTGAGVWRRPLSEMITSVEPSMHDSPHEFSLSQNYPNPFNPSTTIKYELPKSTGVRLSVFDMLGREVSTLVNERREAGVHEIKFDAAGLSSGVYFYRLQAGDFVQTKKLVLTK